jgi:putative membrane protein
VTVLAGQSDDYRYIPLLWASLIALVLPGALLFFTGWLAGWQLLLVQWLTFLVLAVLFRIPKVTSRLIPRSVRHWRACNLARRQFIELNLHHTDDGTGMLIFVSEAERYVEILVDRGISSRIDNSAWESIVETFTAHVRNGRVLDGFCRLHRRLRHAAPAARPGDARAQRAAEPPGGAALKPGCRHCRHPFCLKPRCADEQAARVRAAGLSLDCADRCGVRR